MKILITGLSGFIGKKLAKKLHRDGHEVFGIGFRRSQDELIEYFKTEPRLLSGYEEVDILDPIAVLDHFRSIEPHFIYHLAAQANLPNAKRNSHSTLQVNIVGSWNVVSAAYRVGALGAHLASSSDVYGPVLEEDQPITEEHPLRGFNPYALSKIAMENVGRCFWEESCRPFSVVVTRLFTTTGTEQYTDAAVSYFAWQAARIALRLQEPVLKCGNIDNWRTFLDVDDVVDAFTLLPSIPKGQKFEDTIFNITGTEQNLREIIEQLQELSGVDFEIHSRKGRKNDITRQIGDGCKFESATDWVPKIPFTETVKKVYQYWLLKLNGGAQCMKK